MSEANHKKRRGVIKGSITRLGTKLRGLEDRASEATTQDLVRQMKEKLNGLDSDFKTHHYAIIDTIPDENEDDFAREQQALDEHDDIVSDLAVRIQQLLVACTSASTPDSYRVSMKRLRHLMRGLSTIDESCESSLERDDKICLLRQLEEQVSDYKKELADIRSCVFSLDLEDSDPLCSLQAEIEEGVFNKSLKIKKLLQSETNTITATVPASSKGVKLPKLDVPKFDGNILNWKSFWDQFCVSVHDRPHLSDSEKLVYLQHALKDGSAKHVIEGLSRSGEYYSEAVECLQCRFDRPRLIHQTHVRMILDAPSLKDGTGKELRRLHDTVQQHLRALKAMDYDPSGPFITSALELKLDTSTMFEWQKHSQDTNVVPHYSTLLEFLNLRAQACESATSDPIKKPKHEVHPNKKHNTPGKAIASFTGTANPVANCIFRETEKHPLYACAKFKALPHDKMLATLKANKICINCLKPDHFVRQCKSQHRCKKCQKPHHTLLHIDTKDETPPSQDSVPGSSLTSAPLANTAPLANAAPLANMAPLATMVPLGNTAPRVTTPVSAHAAMELKSNSLLMTCLVLVDAPDGSSVQTRAILDCASSASFVSERLVQSLKLPRSFQDARISGVAGLSRNSPLKSIASFKISAVQHPSHKIDITAVVVPRVTCELPLHPVHFNARWSHLSDLPLADPGFGQPGRIDLLLGVEVFVEVMRHGRRMGPPGSPVAFETAFGWVLAGGVESCSPNGCIASHHSLVMSGDDILCKFWEIEDKPMAVMDSPLSPEERFVVQHYKVNHSRLDDGKFVVPLPRKPHARALGESRSQAVRRFFSLERSLYSKNQFQEFDTVMRDYFEKGHAERVPESDLRKSEKNVFYLPMHAVRKESSTTTKIRAVFDASAKSSTGVSLNDTLLVGPTVHPTLVDVLLRFRLHRVALTTDVSQMYRAVVLSNPDRDLHRFVWRSNLNEPLRDYHMTRVTFGVSASSFAANMSVRQNAIDLSLKYPQAAGAAMTSFYVDDGLTGADSIEEAIRLQGELQELFLNGGFLLRKWNSSEHVPSDLQDTHSIRLIQDPTEYTKTLGVEWNSTLDHFRLAIAEFPTVSNVTKRVLVSDVAKTFDVLGWFSPTIIKVKILLQRLWESKVDWDEPVPEEIQEAWSQWRSELSILSSHHIPRYYFPKEASIKSVQLHGFSDASEQAYAGVVYFRMVDSDGNVHTSLVASKTKVAPIKRLTVPRLELCGAHLLAQLLYHVKEVFRLGLCDVYAWTDSTIVLNWLTGSPRRFKTYVGNRVSYIMELISPERWKHVQGVENPADCASRGLFPSELVKHDLWWNGPMWLQLESTRWPKQVALPPNMPSDEQGEVCFHTAVLKQNPIFPIDRFSTYTRLKYVTAWIFRFLYNCQAHKKGSSRITSSLTVEELTSAEKYWLLLSQSDFFPEEVETIKEGREIARSSSLLPLHPFLDASGLLRVGGREQNSKLPYYSQHPVIVHGKHQLVKLIIHSEHQRLLHAGPTLLTSSLGRRFHIVGCRKVIRSVTRGCLICRRNSAKPKPPIFGQLPMERITPDLVFSNVGVDYAGPLSIKYGHVRKPTIIKAYICVFVSLTVKAVHLEAVSDLTTEAFIATLRRFIARRGKPSLIWSDHGSNFVGAARELCELFDFLKQQRSEKVISEFCSSQNIVWDFIPEHAPHFGGLWEAAVKSMKAHLKRVMSNVKLTFEELTTLLTQIEACLNSRPLVPLPCDEDGVEALTPGHFLIGRPLEALPDPAFTYRSPTLLRRWHLCQALVRHFWQRWSAEYLSSLQRFSKWHRPSRNAAVGDVVVLREDNMVPTKWPLARITEIHPGRDGIVRVVTVKTSTGTYNRPVTKVALLLPYEH